MFPLYLTTTSNKLFQSCAYYSISNYLKLLLIIFQQLMHLDWLEQKPYLISDLLDLIMLLLSMNHDGS